MRNSRSILVRPADIASTAPDVEQCARILAHHFVNCLHQCGGQFHGQFGQFPLRRFGIGHVTGCRCAGNRQNTRMIRTKVHFGGRQQCLKKPFAETLNHQPYPCLDRDATHTAPAGSFSAAKLLVTMSDTLP